MPVPRALASMANTADGVLAVTAGHRIVLWNRAATALLGRQRSEVIGRFCYEVICGRDRVGGALCHQDCAPMAAARGNRLPPTTTIVARSKDGSSVELSVTTVVVLSAAGHLAALVHLFRPSTGSASGSLRAAPEPLPTGPVADATGARLTSRERRVLAELLTGASTTSIAARLGISPRTVRNHVTHVLSKLGVHSRLAAVASVVRHHLAGDSE